ncbi:MAG TPA: hypothetical protein VGC09_00460 [Rhodopila sp.]
MSAWSRPTLAGFLAFVRNIMAVPTEALPDASPSLQWAFDQAIETVNLQIRQASPPMYVRAVYNLAGDVLVNIAPDQAGQKYFTILRQNLGLTAFVPGVIQSSADSSTSESLMVPDALKNMTLADLQNLKTPWGREYLGIAQSVGSIWGLT